MAEKSQSILLTLEVAPVVWTTVRPIVGRTRWPNANEDVEVFVVDKLALQEG